MRYIGVCLFMLCASVYAEAVEDMKKIVFVGDSLTAGGQWSSWFPDDDVSNRGISGNTAADVLARIDTIKDADATHYVVMVGINDLTQGVAEDDIINHVEHILEHLSAASPEAEILLQSVLPVNDDFREFTLSNHDIMSVNRRLQAQADQRGIKYVNVHAWLLDDEGNLIKAYASDGVHLNDAGYQVWLKVLRENL